MTPPGTSSVDHAASLPSPSRHIICDGNLSNALLHSQQKSPAIAVFPPLADSASPVGGRPPRGTHSVQSHYHSFGALYSSRLSSGDLTRRCVGVRACLLFLFRPCPLAVPSPRRHRVFVIGGVAETPLRSTLVAQRQRHGGYLCRRSTPPTPPIFRVINGIVDGSSPVISYEEKWIRPNMFRMA
ncbi:hypothetical protein V9T40_009872 [Parthenolecanium corni]|uniref:Uncharacterized protein n=1 Tax=Parthenolecanium corni TaxID=536013 RepID=A0AAN9TY10_9HEMI